MPKEKINHSTPDDRFQLEVGWQRDMDVQVGIATSDGRHLVDEFYGQEAVLQKIGDAMRNYALAPENLAALNVGGTTLGRVVLDVVTGSDYGMSSLWWHPDRDQINSLIRLLRKARDAAYGADA